MNAPGGGGDAGGSLPACVERPILRTTWTKMMCAHGTHGKQIDNRMEGRGKLKKRNPVLFTKDRTPI